MLRPTRMGLAANFAADVEHEASACIDALIGTVTNWRAARQAEQLKRAAETVGLETKR